MSAGASAASLPGLDAARVSAWIAAHVAGAEPPLRFERIGHGESNLTFAVRDARGERWVLRRPPLGTLLPSAHDMLREHRVLAALGTSGVPVPRTLALCEDSAVTGAPFYLMQHVEGRVVVAREDALALPAAARADSARSLVEALARLHALDADAVGLGELGPRAGYAERQLRRWRRQWEASKTREIPAIERVADQLAARLPQQREVAIVHGDYRLDNVLVGDDGRVRAVLDWELCTLGDPLADLGTLLVYWPEPGDPIVPFADPATLAPGFPSREALAAAYADASGRDLAALELYRALGCWKLAVIAQGVHRRRLADPANGSAASARAPRVDQFAQLAELVLQQAP